MMTTMDSQIIHSVTKIRPLGSKIVKFEAIKNGSTYSVLHIVAYSPIFKDFVSHIKCATYCVLHFFNVI